MKGLWQGTTLLCIVLALCTCFAGCTGTANSGSAATTPAADDFSGWNLTIAGETTKVLSLNELRDLPTAEGNGYAVSTVGIRYGPYACKGVDLRDLAELVGELGETDQLWISAPDGYLWVFDNDQLQGRGFITLNEDLKEIASPTLRVILMYEQNGTPLAYDDGGPCRIAVISDQPGVVTEGSAWVKWVDRIEVKKG